VPIPVRSSSARALIPRKAGSRFFLYYYYRTIKPCNQTISSAQSHCNVLIPHARGPAVSGTRIEFGLTHSGNGCGAHAAAARAHQLISLESRVHDAPLGCIGRAIRAVHLLFCADSFADSREGWCMKRAMLELSGWSFLLPSVAILAMMAMNRR
jgi:hypothetical protein